MDETELTTTFTQPKPFAVTVQNAYKRYSLWNVVLNGLNLSVPDSSIYGLLGPSGCGKTTLLNCIMGQSKLDAGSIQLKVNKRAEIGYMPQTLGLHEQLTIYENIYLYGSFHGFSNAEVKTRAKDLICFLELPSGNRQVTSLSEGQRRRVSLAITFIHKPQILILDEPTVGLDLILSRSVWKRLLEMAEKGTTIIITTHYIQEAQNAHTIGLMRDGVLLAEENPYTLMEKHDRSNLEDVFLVLSQGQERRTIHTYPEVKKSFMVHYRDDKIFSKKKVKGILYKDLTLLKRALTVR